MSKLDSYISKLLSDDDALKDFLVDPIKAAEDDHGLTKGQRSILRRVVASLSNNATNGYSIVRHLDSYRRSIRLLQNVLHLERGHAVSQAQTTSEDDSVTYTITVYINGDESDPQGTKTSPAAQYRYNVQYTATFDSYDSTRTIKDIMNAATAVQDSSVSLQYEYNANVVKSFSIPSSITPSGADSGKYVAAPVRVNKRKPFWFFSVGGQAITGQGSSYSINPDASYGYAGDGGEGTFEKYVPADGETQIYWQCIAPDTIYGFQSCDPTTTDNAFAK
jgi:hypothetical protein